MAGDLGWHLTEHPLIVAHSQLHFSVAVFLSHEHILWVPKSAIKSLHVTEMENQISMKILLCCFLSSEVERAMNFPPAFSKYGCGLAAVVQGADF